MNRGLSVVNFSEQFLNEVLEERKGRNQSYSVRAFARDLGIGKTTLSEVLSGNRRLSKNNLTKICEKLEVSEHQKKLLESDNLNQRVSPQELENLFFKEDQLKMIANWYYLAILNLTKVKKNKAEAKWIANRLGVSVNQANDALDVLIRMKLLTVKRGKLVRTSNPIHSTEDIPSKALKKHHEQMLQQAEQSLYRDATDIREISTVTMGIKAQDFEKARKMLRNFRKRFMKVIETDEPNQADEVYALGLHFFPLTKSQNKESGV